MHLIILDLTIWKHHFSIRLVKKTGTFHTTMGIEELNLNLISFQLNFTHLITSFLLNLKNITHFRN